MFWSLCGLMRFGIILGYNLEALAESASAHVRALVENIKQTQGDSVEVENLTLAINSVSLTENSVNIIPLLALVYPTDDHFLGTSCDCSLQEQR